MLVETGKKQASNRRFKLTACMMVKNEEKNLPRCLGSLKNFFDELIVVDTGSTDKTMEIAKSHGAKVYEHPWENNFSKHRNQSIEHATGDWVMIVDADEELLFANDNHEVARQVFEEYAVRHAAMAILAEDYQRGRVVMKFHTTRFFPKDGIHYEGIVHNQPVVKGRAVLFPGVRVRHHGYDLTPEAKEAKYKRTRTLLLERLEKDPTDYNCYFYLSQLTANMGKSKECCEWSEKYLKHKANLNGLFNQSVYYTTIHAYIKIGDVKGAGKWLKVGLKDLPQDMDLSLALVEYGHWIKNQNLVDKGAKRFIALQEKFQKQPTLKGNRFIYSDNAEALCYCAAQLCKSRLKEGFEALNKISANLGQTDDKFQNKISKDLQETLSPLGINLSLKRRNREDDNSGVRYKHRPQV